MPGATFLEEEDNMLVQTASKMSEQGTRRKAWKDVTRKVKRWKRSPEELARRINSLKPPFGTDLTKFPASLYTAVHATRGRRSAQVVLIRQGSSKRTSQRQASKTETHRSVAANNTSNAALPALLDVNDIHGPGAGRVVQRKALGEDSSLVLDVVPPSISEGYEPLRQPSTPNFRDDPLAIRMDMAIWR
ncbi:hypothetical protein JG687_00005203 [Phytophthora cactorum]|uniref:Myb-like domain-containing protein n=1 Tax=Phytophthora cactorum TaxID=29920 RepID=A0A329SWD0_9STRA|nr:hypothetical protein PC112_g586 [Phytophthora cactorum]KAG4243970.1 hypothetical protein PC116_g8171 [Phytophthora cactorum]KAG6965851.1 hypothetical protein JG687_00005203 [Phytophthora cactorum]RAW40909.1 hypothetical protein PC110_g2855 [Phytophthora cactorum]